MTFLVFLLLLLFHVATCFLKHTHETTHEWESLRDQKKLDELYQKYVDHFAKHHHHGTHRVGYAQLGCGALTNFTDKHRVHLPYKYHPYNKVENSKGSNTKRRLLNENIDYEDETVFEAIRISPYYTLLDQDLSVFTQSVKDRMYNLIRSAISASIRSIQKILKVVPYPGTFRFPRSQFLCTLSALVPFDLKEGSLGLKDTDFVLFIRSLPCSLYGQPGGACLFDQYGRPLAGSFTICRPPHNALGGWGDTKGTLFENSDWNFANDMMQHLLLHVLGFDASQMQGEWYSRELGRNYVYTDILGVTFIQRVKQIYIKTPECVDAAREYFACHDEDVAVGCFLENLDTGFNLNGIGETTQHLEERFYHGEVMNKLLNHQGQPRRMSSISCAVMDSTGHYQVDYTECFPLLFGYHQGCDFITEPCVTDGQPNFNEFCMDRDLTGCDYDFINIATCDYSENIDTPPLQFRYFSSPTIGGPSETNWCPIRIPKEGYRTNDCRWTLRAGNARCAEKSYESDGKRLGSCVPTGCVAYDKDTNHWAGAVIWKDPEDFVLCLEMDGGEEKDGIICPRVVNFCVGEDTDLCWWGFWDQKGACRCFSGWWGRKCQWFDMIILEPEKGVAGEP